MKIGLQFMSLWVCEACKQERGVGRQAEIFALTQGCQLMGIACMA